MRHTKIGLSSGDNGFKNYIVHLHCGKLLEQRVAFLKRKKLVSYWKPGKVQANQ